MGAAPGWYADPMGSPQLRFWDGQNWTTATTAIPQAPQAPQVHAQTLQPAAAQFGPSPQQAYSPSSQEFFPPALQTAQPASPGRPFASTPPRRGMYWGKRWIIGLASFLVLAVIAAVALPIALASNKSSLSADFKRSLLTPETVGALAGGNFTIDTSNDNSSNEDKSSECRAFANSSSLTGVQDKADVGRAFTSEDVNLYVDEELANNTTAAEQLEQVRSALKSCHSATFAGHTLSMELGPTPTVAGSDDAVALQMTGDASGRTVVLDASIARFGHNIISIICGGIGSRADMSALTEKLMTEAVEKARPVLRKN